MMMIIINMMMMNHDHTLVSVKQDIDMMSWLFDKMPVDAVKPNRCIDKFMQSNE
jgi:hypothetical protein